MRLIIAGSRDIPYSKFMELMEIYEHYFSDGCVYEVVSGGARGVDTYGEGWAASQEIPIKMFPAKWDEYGKSAGFKRNQKMAEYADELFAVWDGKSKGTRHMINIMLDAGKPVHVEIVK